MNKAIKIVCSQNMANYRKPSSIQFQESFKLPPYSTVIGMVHKACNFTDYKSMNVSIQGNSKSSVVDMYTRYFFGISYDPTRHQLCVINKDGSQDGVTRGLGYAELIVDVSLIIHIKPEDEALFSVIVDGLKNPSVYPSLGRYEDILRIDSVDIVDIEETNIVVMNNDAYIPTKYFENNADEIGSVYKLNKKFSIDEKTNIRKWDEKVEVKYIKAKKRIKVSNKVFKEKDTNIGVFFA